VEDHVTALELYTVCGIDLPCVPSESRKALRSPKPLFLVGAARLDSDPMNRHPLNTATARSCAHNTDDCIEWDPESIWVTPSAMERALVFSAFPAFLIGMAVVHGLGRLGVNEVASFMLTIPVCTALWFYSVGWLLDRWRYKRLRRVVQGSS